MATNFLRFGAPLLGLLLTIGIYGSGDTATVIEPSDALFPSEKLTLSETDLPELTFYGETFGFDASESVDPNGRDAGANRGGELRDNPNRERQAGPSKVDRIRRILGVLQLSDRQIAAVRRCFAQFEDCKESATTRARAVRAELHQELVTKLRRIRAALADGSITPARATELYRECIIEYGAKVRRLIKAHRAAIEECCKELITCIAGTLNDRQLARFRELLSQGDRNGDGRDGGDRDGDDDGDEDDGEGDGRDRGGNGG